MNLNLTRFGLRVTAFFTLLTPGYPSADEELTVQVTMRYLELTKELKVGLARVKWFLVIPHYVIFALKPGMRALRNCSAHSAEN